MAPSWSVDDKVTVALVETVPKVAVAAVPSTVDPGGSARLTATARDPDGGSIVSYAWSQLPGPEPPFGRFPEGRFDQTDGATATWTAPKPVEAENPEVEIQVVVTDDDGETATGTVTISVSNPQHSLRYSGQQHSQAWKYYTGDGTTRGQPEITVRTLAGLPRLICGHDGATNSGGLYCGDGVDHEWEYVDASLSGGVGDGGGDGGGGGGGTGGGGSGSGGTSQTVPDAPTNLLLERGDGQVTLTWEAPEDDGGSEITDYEYRINGQGSWISIGSTDTTLHGQRARQRYGLHVRGAGGEPHRQEPAFFGPGGGDATGGGGPGLRAFRQWDRHYLRDRARECGPLSDPSRPLLLRPGWRSHRPGIGGGSHGRSGGHRGRKPERAYGDGAVERTHDCNPRARGAGVWIGESGLERSHRGVGAL